MEIIRFMLYAALGMSLDNISLGVQSPMFWVITIIVITIAFLSEIIGGKK